MIKLPKVLEREPLIDAVFEVRLDGSVSHADLLPGILFHELSPKPQIKRLPTAELPQPVRANDPNLRYAPTQRLEWDKYVVAVGDQTIVISCKLPYEKWTNFKKTILNVTERIAKMGVAGKVERYSIKYVNLIEGATLADQIKKIELNIDIGSMQVTDEHINVQVHHVEDDVVHILTVVSGASGTMSDGKEIQGIVVAIDSIRNIELCDFAKFARDLEPELEKLKQSNKVLFFKCLKQGTINEMRPRYE